MSALIDRSQTQKRMRVEKLKVELLELGFSVVPTEWLKSMFWEAKLEMNRRPRNETTDNPRSHRSQGRSAESIQSQIP